MLALTAIGQEKKKREFVNLKLDTFDKIVVIDHQNLNYNWYYGRVYEIVKKDDTYEMYRINQHNRPYFFGQSKSLENSDTLDFDQMKLLDTLGISKDNKEELLSMVNAQNSTSHGWYSDRIKIENSKERIFIREIEVSEIQQLEIAINAKRESFINYTYSVLGVDSTWLSANADNLFEKYNDYRGSKKAKAYCIKCIKDLEKTKVASYSIYSGWSTSDYPFCAIQLINDQDTLTISTNAQRAYMLPWNIADQYESYNANISIAFGNLLPNNENSNKRRLTGQEAKALYERQLMVSIINRYCKKNWKKLKTK